MTIMHPVHTIPHTQKRVLVIGGGISGLAAAHYLQQRGIKVRVLEKNHRPGGLIQSERVAGFLLEHAATCLFNFLPEVDLFCQNLGLNGEQLFRQEAARRRYLIRDGRPVPVPMSVGGFVQSNLISLPGKLRLLLEPFIPRGPGDGDQETVAQFVTRRLGREMYERAIEPYVSGTLAGDGERACLRSTFSQLAALEQEHGSLLKGMIWRKLAGIRTSGCGARVFSFRQGMAAMAQAVARQLGADFMPGHTVTSLMRQGPVWQVTSVDDQHRGLTHAADAVLVATPAQDAAGLLESLSQPLGRLLRGITYAPMVIVHLGFARQDLVHPLDGIGCLVPRCEAGWELLGSLWSSTLFADRAPAGQVLLMNYLGGSRHPEAGEWTDQALIERSMADLRRMVGVRGTPSLARVIRHARALPGYQLGHPLFLRGLDEQLALLPGIFLAGNYLRGVSVRACISQGEQAAAQITHLLSVQETVAGVREPSRPPVGVWGQGPRGR
ncbi:MAG: protoporphyrinogen oxidase [Magnetococcus sp. DMHC-8]